MGRGGVGERGREKKKRASIDFFSLSIGACFEVLSLQNVSCSAPFLEFYMPRLPWFLVPLTLMGACRPSLEGTVSGIDLSDVG